MSLHATQPNLNNFAAE